MIWRKKITGANRMDGKENVLQYYVEYPTENITGKPKLSLKCKFWGFSLHYQIIIFQWNHSVKNTKNCTENIPRLDNGNNSMDAKIEKSALMSGEDEKNLFTSMSGTNEEMRRWWWWWAKDGDYNDEVKCNTIQNHFPFYRRSSFAKMQNANFYCLLSEDSFSSFGTPINTFPLSVKTEDYNTLRGIK